MQKLLSCWESSIELEYSQSQSEAQYELHGGQCKDLEYQRCGDPSLPVVNTLQGGGLGRSPSRRRG